jgi:hypothetical protein
LPLSNKDDFQEYQELQILIQVLQIQDHKDKWLYISNSS